MRVRFQCVIVLAFHLSVSLLASSQERPSAVDSSQGSQVARIIAKTNILRDEMSRVGLTFQGTYVNDWTLDSSPHEQDPWFGRYSFDFFFNLDGEKLLGWHGGSGSVRLKQHLSQFGDESRYALVSQLYSNIDGNSRTSIYELWVQQTALNNKVRVKIGKVDANSEFATVAVAGDFLNASMGYSPTVMYFPTYPEPKPGIMAFFTPQDRYQVAAGAFKTNANGTLAIGEVGLNWTGGERERHGKASLGYWHLQQKLTCFDGDIVPAADGFYSVLQQSLWRQSADTRSLTREITGFLQLGTGNGDMNSFTRHIGGGVILNQPFSVHDALGLGATRVNYSRQPSAGFNAGMELAVEAYYKVQIHPNVAFEPDFQLFQNPGGMQGHGTLLALTPRLIISF